MGSVESQPGDSSESPPTSGAAGVSPNRAARSIKEVIDDAICEGRRWERLCYGFVALFVVAGVAVLIGGAFAGSGLTSLAGSVCASLFWPALRYADGVRRDLIRTRMYEMALVKAKGHKAIASLLREALGEIAKGDKP